VAAVAAGNPSEFAGRVYGCGKRGFTCSLFLLSVAFGCGSPRDHQESSTAFLNQAPDVEYVGMEACRSCHLAKFATYKQTGMARAFYPLSSETAVEDFTVDNVFVANDSGLQYRMEQRDGKFYQRQYVLDSRGREIAVDERELVFVIGSNNHSRSYLTLVGDKLFQAPVCWYPQEEIWEFCPSYDTNNAHFTRTIRLGCVSCHNAKMSLVEGTVSEYETPYPHGIDCERCHGPGQLHVERWADATRTPTGEIDPTIVNPRRLQPETRIQVCYQCHLGDAGAGERVNRLGTELRDYRPGQPITDYLVPFTFADATEYAFGLSSQGDRLMLSRCFQESGGRIECITCHNPHVTVYHDERPDDFFRNRCLGCHATEDCREPQKAREETRPVDDCVACHMRKAEPHDQRFTEMTDHWIRKNIDVAQPDRRGHYEIRPMFPDVFASLPRGEQAYYRGIAASRMALQVPSQEQQQLLDTAEKALEEAIAHGLDDAATWFALSQVRARSNRPEAADAALESAYARDPTRYESAFAVGQASVARGNLPRAQEIFEGIIEREAESPAALAELGRVLSMMRQLEQALEHLDRAVLLQPWTASLHVGQGKALAQLGRFDEAAQKAVDAANLDPDAPRVWDFFEKAHLAAGRPDEAAEARRILDRLQRGTD